MRTGWIDQWPAATREGVSDLLELPTEALREAASRVSYPVPGESFFETSVIESVATRFGVPTTRLANAMLTVATMVYTEVSERGDVEEIVEDLRDKGYVQEADKILERIRVCYSPLKESIERYLRFQYSLHGTFPIYRGMATRNASVFAVAPEFSNTDTPDTYAPDSVSSMTVVVASISLAEHGKEETVRVALTPKDLNDAIHHLEMARAQLRAIQQGNRDDAGE